MTVKRADVAYVTRLESPLYNPTKPDAKVSRSTMGGILSKAETNPKLGKAGAKAIKAAYDAARTKAGADPTYKEIRAQLSRAESSLRNERAKGRTNDGYVDDREAAALKSDVAKEVYAFLSKNFSFSAPADAKVKATKAQLAKAHDRLNHVVDAGFKAFKAVPNGNYPELIGAMRTAAKAAGIASDGIAALVIATNGATGRGDNGSLTDGGNSLPTVAEVKKALMNAHAKLLTADGAKVVDFAHASRPAKSKRDGVVTGLEVDRTPLVQGKAAHAFLKYAGTL